jgi:xanthine dehydrogenase accessory factor
VSPVSVYDELRDACAERLPRGAGHRGRRAGHTGAKLLVRPGHDPLGSLGDPDLDRVVARDALGELAAGATGVRHYGAQGQARGARRRRS